MLLTAFSPWGDFEFCFSKNQLPGFVSVFHLSLKSCPLAPRATCDEKGPFWLLKPKPEQPSGTQRRILLDFMSLWMIFFACK
jgi:hypothetical protein